MKEEEEEEELYHQLLLNGKKATVPFNIYMRQTVHSYEEDNPRHANR